LANWKGALEVAAVLIGALGLYGLWTLVQSWLRLRRAEYIRTYKLPRGLLAKLEEKYPGLTRKETALVSRGLRQFFVAYLMSGKEYVSMPSQAVDELWHEFILYTRDYQSFCRRAFGEFLHHQPAAVLRGGINQSDAGLRRVWWYTCKYENIDPARPTRLPLLFALDVKLSIPNGFRYEADCEQTRNTGAKEIHCGGDFSNPNFGSLEGFGPRRLGGKSNGCGAGGCGGGGSGSDGGSGCGGGGCGGGGGD
jgi:hypothetical protein